MLKRRYATAGYAAIHNTLRLSLRFIDYTMVTLLPLHADSCH